MNIHWAPNDLVRFPEIDREARELWEKSQVKFPTLSIHFYPTLAEAICQPAEM